MLDVLSQFLDVLHVDLCDFSDKNEHENVKKREDKLLEEVSDCLKLCSRQRLRAVHMSMRQYGNEASGKDVIKLLQVFPKILNSTFCIEQRLIGKNNTIFEN